MLHSHKYNISKLLCVLTLLFGSMLFTGYTSSPAAVLQPGAQTELLFTSNCRIKKNTVAYHSAGAVDQHKIVPVCNTHIHACFIFHQNRLTAIRFKTASILVTQFSIQSQLMQQKTIPASSPEQLAIS